MVNPNSPSSPPPAVFNKYMCNLFRNKIHGMRTLSCHVPQRQTFFRPPFVPSLTGWLAPDKNVIVRRRCSVVTGIYYYRRKCYVFIAFSRSRFEESEIENNS